MAIGTIGFTPLQLPIPTAPALTLPPLAGINFPAPPVAPGAPVVRTPAAPAGSFPMTFSPVFAGPSFGPVIANSSSPSAQALQQLFSQAGNFDRNGTANFFSQAVQLQMSGGDLISAALGMAQVAGGNTGSGTSIRELSTQLQQAYGPVLEAESKLQEESVATFKELKNEVFATHHYQFDANGQNPTLVEGKESVADRARRLSFESRQRVQAAQRVAASPQAAEQRRLNALVAQNPGNKQLLIQLDAANTALQVESMKANLAAELPPAGPGASTEIRDSLASFGNSAITDWAGFHAANIQRMAADPQVDRLLAAQTQQQQALAQSQAQLAATSQQMLAQGQALARPF